MRSSTLAAIAGVFIFLTASIAVAAPQGAASGQHLSTSQADALVAGHGGPNAPAPMRRSTRCYDHMRRAGFSPCLAAHSCNMGQAIEGAVCG